MNWYKKLLKICQKIDTPTYLNIGHYYAYPKWKREEMGMKEQVSPNYLWVLYKGKILTAIETTEKPTHRRNFGLYNEDWNEAFYGRYESDTGNLSVSMPQDPKFYYRDIPESLLNKLYEIFPGIKEVHKF